MALTIVQIPAGSMANFTYLVFDPKSRRGLGVDPSFGAEALLAAVREHGVHLEFLVNTHGHNDHVAGNPAVLSATGTTLAAHPLDVPTADVPLGEGSVLQIGGENVEVLHTPGHTPGSIALRSADAVITGDTLFVTRVGRADLPGSDPEALYHSLRRLASLPDDTVVYPGHDYGPRPVSTIAAERANNPYLRCPDLAAFLKLRMG